MFYKSYTALIELLNLSMRTMRSARALMVSPRNSWTLIKELPVSNSDLIFRILMPLCAVPPLLGLFSSLVIGIHIPVWGVWRMPFGDALFYYLLQYLWLFCSVMVAAWILFKVSRQLGDEVSENIALKVCIFSAIPVFISGVGVILPFYFLQIISSLIALYGLVLLYFGIEQCTQLKGLLWEKAFTYTTAGSLLTSLFFMLFSNVILLNDYSLFSPAFTPMSHDVHALLKNMYELEQTGLQPH